MSTKFGDMIGDVVTSVHLALSKSLHKRTRDAASAKHYAAMLMALSAAVAMLLPIVAGLRQAGWIPTHVPRWVPLVVLWTIVMVVSRAIRRTAANDRVLRAKKQMEKLDDSSQRWRVRWAWILVLGTYVFAMTYVFLT